MKVSKLDIAPRIKELNHEIDHLNNSKMALDIKLLEKVFLSENEILPYLDDLRATLDLGTIGERKSFIRSFIKKIWIDYPTATIENTTNNTQRFQSILHQFSTIYSNGYELFQR